MKMWLGTWWRRCFRRWRHVSVPFHPRRMRKAAGAAAPVPFRFYIQQQREQDRKKKTSKRKRSRMSVKPDGWVRPAVHSGPDWYRVCAALYRRALPCSPVSGRILLGWRTMDRRHLSRSLPHCSHPNPNRHWSLRSNLQMQTIQFKMNLKWIKKNELKKWINK